MERIHEDFGTGGGFIGSAVVRLAIARGYHSDWIFLLCGLFGKWASVAGHPNYAFEQVDIRDKFGLDKVLEKHSPDAIMHLAAESHVDRSIDSPVDFIETNINGTVNILMAARDYWITNGKPNIFRFHHISTDEVYGSLGPTGMFTEDMPRIHAALIPRQSQF